MSYGRGLGRVVINCDQSTADAFGRFAHGAVEHLCVDVERRIDLGVAHQLRRCDSGKHHAAGGRH